MTSTSSLDVKSCTMKEDGYCPPNNLPVQNDLNRDDEEEEEVDPNLYGEDIPNFVRDEPNNLNPPSLRPCSPAPPLPRIKQEPEDTVIKREQSPSQPLNYDNIPLGGEDEPKDSPAVEASSQDPKPPKRRRLIPEVVLYTWKDLQSQRQKDFEKIKKMSNPIVKKPKNIEFNVSTLYDRLKPFGLDPVKITLEPDIRDQPVSRAFMSSVYGGGAQDTFPRIGNAKFAEHGMGNFMYVNASLHTHAPQWPGNPGLFFDSETLWRKDLNVYKTFVRLDSAKWLYLGDYRLHNVEPLSKEDWNLMTVKVRNAWVNYIMRKGWATGFRARVVARRELGRRPTEAELDRVIDEGRSGHVTPPEIHAALEAGHERLGIIGLKCHRYDEAFQRQLVERFGRWTPPAPKPRGEKRGRQAENDLKLEDPESKPKIKQEVKTEPEIQTPLKPRKRKRRATPESDAELSLESEDADIGHSLQQDKHFKKKLRQNTVVKKQEPEDELVVPSDNGSESEDGEWRPNIKISNNVFQPQPQVSSQQQTNGTRMDPIIL